MQLSTLSQIDGKPSMVVDFYPIQVPFGGYISPRHMLKVFKFQGCDTMSTKCITKIDFRREVEERIGNGWEVTGFNTTAQQWNPMSGGC